MYQVFTLAIVLAIVIGLVALVYVMLAFKGAPPAKDRLAVTREVGRTLTRLRRPKQSGSASTLSVDK